MIISWSATATAISGKENNLLQSDCQCKIFVQIYFTNYEEYIDFNLSLIKIINS